MTSHVSHYGGPYISYHHKLVEGDSSHAICTLCCKSLSRGKNIKVYSTSLLFKHLSAKHPTEYELCKAESNEATGTTASQSQTGQQSGQTITNFTSPALNKQWTSDHPLANAIHAAIGKMIAVDLQPYSIVEDTGFSELVQQLEPHYKLPSRRFFADKIIPGMYETMASRILPFTFHLHVTYGLANTLLSHI